ncbi:MAG: hypothetical protein HY425_03125 [Candidatus Levybacteria bacterium]|nr:hypothetical protein [Candidatus Levybacteria bacterium]
MLTKKDFKDIKVMMVDSLGEFFETVLVPYFDHEHKKNQKEHEEIKVELGDKIDLIDEHLKDHKKRISKLEDVASII